MSSKRVKLLLHASPQEARKPSRVALDGFCPIRSSVCCDSMRQDASSAHAGSQLTSRVRRVEPSHRRQLGVRDRRPGGDFRVPRHGHETTVNLYGRNPWWSRYPTLRQVCESRRLCYYCYQSLPPYPQCAESHASQCRYARNPATCPKPDMQVLWGIPVSNRFACLSVDELPHP